MVFSTATTGLPSAGDFSSARLLQLAWIVYDGGGRVQEQGCSIVRPEGFQVGASHIHGITAARVAAEGVPFQQAVAPFLAALSAAGGAALSFSAAFHTSVLLYELCLRSGQPFARGGLEVMRAAHIGDVQKLLGKSICARRKPVLGELYAVATGRAMMGARDAEHTCASLGEAVVALGARMPESWKPLKVQLLEGVPGGMAFTVK